MTLEQLRNLDANNPGSWPLPVKTAALVLVLIAVVAGAWYFHWEGQMRTIERVRAEEQKLRQEFDTKQRRAANLEAYEAQLEEMRRTFGDMLRQLPSRAEVAELLVDISQTGLASGLEFELFRPQNAVTREFYAELPVAIRVRGDYHQFARFVSGVANLPRIVTLHDIAITGASEGAGGSGGDTGKLTMTLTAKTYWYLDEEESGS
jgi:type IV pilus assembly protein PilO